MFCMVQEIAVAFYVEMLGIKGIKGLIKALFVTIIAIIIMTQNVFAMPPVQSITGGNGVVYNANNHGVITYPASVNAMKMAADWLAQKLSEENDHRWQVIAIGSESRVSGDIEIHTMPEDSQIPYKNTDKRYHEAYIIHVSKTIKLYAGGSAGALYGVQKLLEMIHDDSLMQATTIVDYPDYKWRGVYVIPNNTTCGDPYKLKGMKKKKWQVCMETLIDYWSSLRINGLFIQSPIFYRLSDDDIRLLGRLFSYARLSNIEPVPVLGSKLWDIPLDYLKQDAIEGIFHKDVEFKVESGSLLPVNISEADSESYAWAIKYHPISPDWHTVTETENIEKEYIAIDLPVNNKPWKSQVFLKNAVGTTLLSVQPGQYYELMISIRADKNSAARIGVRVKDFDKKGNSLSGLHRSSDELFASHKWQRRSIPVFASRKSHTISLRISARNIDNTTVHVELANPALIPMQGQLINVLDNDETAPIVKSKDGLKQYVRDKDYEIRHAIIKEWREVAFEDIKKTEIKLLPGSEIHNGQHLDVSFDMLPLEYRAIPMSKYSTASSYTYEEYHRIFERLKMLSPKFIHISLDEHAGGLNRDSRSKKLSMCNRDLYVGYVNTLNSLLREHTSIMLPQGGSMSGVGLTDTKLIMWDDMLNPWHNGSTATYQVPFGGASGGTGLLSDSDCSKNIKLHQPVWLASWWYKDNDDRGIVEKTPALYRKLGYQYFMSTWYQQDGIGNWSKAVEPSDTQGFIATTWNRREQGVPIMACVAWNRTARKKCLTQPD